MKESKKYKERIKTKETSKKISQQTPPVLAHSFILMDAL